MTSLRERLILLTALCAAAPWPALAASPEPASYETVVTASRGEEAAFESPRLINSVNHKAVKETLPENIPELLEDSPGITMQRTNAAGGAPIMRGLLGQHVLLLVDGVRLNTSITRHGPNQLLNTVDLFQVHQVEILRGPGSVLYGSDAMGGVINIITRKPHFDPRRAWDASFEGTGVFDSANRGLLGHLGLDGNLRSVGLRVGGSFKNFGDLTGGRDTGLQPFTGFWEGDADISAAWTLGERSMLRLSYAAVRQHDAPRTDRSSPADFRLFSDQLRDLAALNYTAAFDNPLLNRVDATLSFQSQRELRERFRLSKDQIEREKDQVGALGVLVGLSTELPYNRLTYGVDLYHDWISSSAEQESIAVPRRQPLERGRYVDGSRYLQAGFYLQDHLSLGRKLAFDLGGRVNTWNIQIPEDPSSGMDAISSTQTGVVGSLHGRYLVGDGLNLVAGVSQGFRAPNVDDFSALGCSGQGYDVPNPELKPEKSLTAEAGVKLNLFGVLSGSIFYFFTHLDDLIVRAPASGATVVEPVCSTDAVGQPVHAPVYKRSNADSGNIHGLEAELGLALGRHWSLFSWVSWARGESIQAAPGQRVEPMSRVPPLNGLAGVRYRTLDQKAFVELSVRWATRQERLSESDLGDIRICPAGAAGCQGTPGFAVISLRGGAELADPLRLTLSVENLSNETYRSHGSGVDGAGLSVVAGLEVLVK